MCFLFVAWSEWLAPKLSALDRKEGENVIKYVRPPLKLENRCPELNFWATDLGLGAQRRGSARRSDWKKNWARTLRQADGRSIRPFSGLLFFFFRLFFGAGATFGGLSRAKCCHMKTSFERGCCATVGYSCPSRMQSHTHTRQCRIAEKSAP